MPVPPFLLKIYDIMSNPLYSEICGWGDNSDSLIIRDIDKFAEVILPKYFKHANYASFTRQLHKYDFHKTVHDPRHGEFKHKYFIKGQPELLELIRRKLYVKKIAPTVENAITDGETDVSSEKDSNFADMDADIFDSLHNYMDFNGNDEFELDFDKFDEIEASVENGMIVFDNERITVLEKRQAHMIEENDQMKKEILENMKKNEVMNKVMECAFSHITEQSQITQKDSGQGCIESLDDIDGLCDTMKSKCTMGLSDEIKASVLAVL